MFNNWFTNTSSFFFESVYIRNYFVKIDSSILIAIICILS